MPKLLIAKPILEKSVAQLQEKANELILKSGITPRLDVILVGDNPASAIYVRNKKKKAELLGAACHVHHLDVCVTEKVFLDTVKQIQMNNEVHGCFIQLPLPKHLQHIQTHSLISPEKDVDGFHPENAFKVFSGDQLDQALLPCTPKGIIRLLDYYGIDLEGKNVCVIGRSMIVGKPIAMLCLERNATVFICHSRTKNLQEITKKSDIIISAVGKPLFLDETFINPERKSVLIDVGINRDENGKLVGDINPLKIGELVQAYTPVPGGIGPMTIDTLMRNLFTAAERQAARDRSNK